jgi:hypothetical protein
VDAAEHAGQLPVRRHRVRDPRGADDAGVRRDEQDRRREHADVHLQHVEREAREAEPLDDPEHGVVLVAALLGRQREERGLLAVDLLDRQRRERDGRECEEDREHRDRRHQVGARDVADRVARLLGEIRGGLDPGVRDHPDRDREEEVSPGGRRAPLDVLDEDLGAEHEHEADQDEEELRREVDDRERHVQRRGLADPDDVQPDEHEDDGGAGDDVPRVRSKGLPEDREVVRHEERRDRDRDHVVQHLGPGSPEADRLVERVPREARRPAGLREADRALGVGHRGGGEDQAGDHEDERGEAEREDGRDAERVVDRRADVAVDGREERGRSEDPLEALLPSAARHRRTLAPAPVSL